MNNLLKNLRHIAKRVFDPAEYKKFLDLAARFPNLNLYNMLLLYYQMPSATLIAGQNAWQDNYGLSVKDDERAICMVRPTLVDEEEITLGYAQIGVFDVSQLVKMPEIKKEEFSIPDFFYESTGCVMAYDTEGILGEKKYEYLDDEFIVPVNEHLSDAENEKNAWKQMLIAFVEDHSDLEDATVEDKALKQGVQYILCKRYSLEPVKFSTVFVNQCKHKGLQFLLQLLETANSIIEQIENRASVEFNFIDMAFINLLIEANSKEEYDSILDLEIEDDDSILSNGRAKFVEKLEVLSSADFNRIFADRQNNRMLTQPPYKIKLIEEY